MTIIELTFSLTLLAAICIAGVAIFHYLETGKLHGFPLVFIFGAVFFSVSGAILSSWDENKRRESEKFKKTVAAVQRTGNDIVLKFTDGSESKMSGDFNFNTELK